MDNRQRRTADMFLRVTQFVATHPIDPPPRLLAEMQRSLEATIERLRSLELEQHGARLGDVRGSRRQVREAMKALVRIARPVLTFAPGAEAALHVPHVRADMATTARRALDLAAALEPHADLLASAGCTAEFLAQFAEHARQLAAVSEQSEGSRRRGARATADIRRELKAAMVAVTVIEGILMRHFDPDSDVMQHWRMARRVTARRGRPPVRRRRPGVGQALSQ